MRGRILVGSAKRVEFSRTGYQPLGEVPGEAMRALRDVTSAFTARGFTHWLTYGALLGLVREGRLIPTDNDLDFAVVEGPTLAEIEATLSPLGFSTYQFCSVGGREALAKFRRGSIVVDVFLEREAGAHYVEEYGFDRHSFCSSTHPKMPLTPLELDGFSIPAPRDREAYLAHLYGPDWRIPARHWDWALSPPNTTIHVHWRSSHKIARRWMSLKLRGR